MILTTRVSRICLAGCFSLLLFTGCGDDEGKVDGPTGEVEGTVTNAGKPLVKGDVLFENDEANRHIGTGLGAGGKFKFENPVPVGKYKVSFLPPEAPEPNDEASGKLADTSGIHSGYQEATSSGIVAEVKEGPNTFTFKLRKKGPKRSRFDEGMNQ